MRDLYVTLGHNSSAVLAIDGVVQRGYEQERFDRVKSSSAFPQHAIEAALGPGDADRFCDNVYVSHWFDEFELESNKYLDLSYLNSLSKNLVTLSPDFTHHDAHAQSGLDFYLSHRDSPTDSYVVVIDGFGNNQECLSVYDSRTMQRIHRSYGYRVSLGLMYQYVTEYLGMKPHRDEYKLLGYESHVTKFAPRELCVSNHAIVSRQGQDHARRMLDSRAMPRSCGALIDYNNLVLAKAQWTELADMWRRLWPQPEGCDGVRSVVGFTAQAFLEACVLEIIETLCVDRSRDLVLVGGVFLNVKLSRRIRRSWIKGNVFAHPLCGDQGAAMGHTRGLFSRNLTWGRRRIGRNIPKVLPIGCYAVDRGDWVNKAANYLCDGQPVNVVRGAAEFGPRALCNTTTFALPNRRSVEIINALNDRDEAMPMAPVLSLAKAKQLLNDDELERAEVSRRFMVTTVGFDERPPDHLMGVAHRDPLEESWTARPQIVDDVPLQPDNTEVWELLGITSGVLINTSYNFHGEPIVQSVEDAIRTHELQRRRCEEMQLVEPITLLVRP